MTSDRPSRTALAGTAATVVACAAIAGSLGWADQPDSGPKEPGALSAAQILERCDEFHFFYADSHMLVRSVLENEDGAVDELDTEVWEKGDKRLVMFHAPPEVAGMAVLVKDADTIYVYEPEFNKVRRIASHAKKQSMLGSDYSFDEMATKKLSVDYEPRVLTEDEHSVVLELQAREGTDKAWPTLKLFIDKDNQWMAEKIQYLDADGNKIKTETRKKLKKIGGKTYPSVLVMTDHVKHHCTTNIVKKATYDAGLPDDMFTKRFLIRED
jgi:outer membrane lipoprotein-sorting protein